jgi:hypothetical protein
MFVNEVTQCGFISTFTQAMVNVLLAYFRIASNTRSHMRSPFCHCFEFEMLRCYSQRAKLCETVRIYTTFTQSSQRVACLFASLMKHMFTISVHHFVRNVMMFSVCSHGHYILFLFYFCNVRPVRK